MHTHAYITTAHTQIHIHTLTHKSIYILHILFYLGFTSILTHIYFTKYVIDSVIIALVKSKYGILSDRDNYGQIP